MKYNALNEEEVAKSFIYIDRSGNTLAIRSANGHYANANAVSARTRTSLSFGTSSSTKFYVNGYAEFPVNGDSESPYIGKSGTTKNLFQVSSVSVDAYEVYRVIITGAPNAALTVNDAHLTCNIEQNLGIAKVYDGGTYFFSKDYVPTAENFTASEVSNNISEVTVNADSKTITLAYTMKWDAYKSSLDAKNAEAKTFLAKNGLGCPKADDPARAELVRVSAEADALTESTADYSELEELTAALTAYINSDNVNMPEDGQAFTITNIRQDGTTTYQLCYTASYGLTVSNDATGAAATFISKKVGDEYVFVYGSGKYMTYKGLGNDGTDAGAVDSYDATKNNIRVTLMPTNQTSIDHFGTFVFCYDGRDGTAAIESSLIVECITTSSKHGFGGDSHRVFMNATWSNVMRIEEVSYPNVVTLNDVDGTSALGTFSAPFPAVIPADANVTAYYAESKNNSEVMMKPITAGEAIPANQGVILEGAAAGTVTMLPRTEETISEITSVLAHTAGAEFAPDAELNAYVLSKVGNDVAFYVLDSEARTIGMNKAYLVLAEGSPAVKLNFGGNLTGIDAVDNGELTIDNAPVYDLSGRVVANPTKGGVYIKNGKKFIVK